MRKLGKKLAVAIALLIALSVASAAPLYPLFGPATGILKGNTNTPQTSAAASSDVIGLWSGTCSAGTFLRGDGACAAVSGAGTVTSVALTMPTGFSVSGSPITASGTLGVTTALSGIVKGSAGAFTTAVAADVYGLWSGTCSASTFLRGDGSCQTPSGAGNVSVSGTPAAGNLTAWASGTTITNGNLSGDCTTSGALSITCTKTSGVAFATSATTDATNAANISAGTLAAGRMPALTGDCTSTVGTVATTCTKTSGVAFAASATTDTTNAANISSGTLSAARGGTGEAGTITGILKGNGTAAHTAAIASDVIGLFTGCSGTQYLGADGACHAGTGNVSTTGTPASGNLTRFTGSSSISNGDLSGDCTTSGALAVTCTKTNGVAFGAFATANPATPPAIGGTTPAAGAFTTLSSNASVSFLNTVTGTDERIGSTVANAPLRFETGNVVRWTLSSNGNMVVAAPASGDNINVSGATGGWGLVTLGSPTTGQSYGDIIVAGTNSSDVSLLVQNQTGSATYLETFGDGGTVVGAPTGGDKGAGSLNTQSLYVNGVPVGSGEGVTAYGLVTSTCTMSQAKNMSCGSHAGTGLYDMAVTGFSAVPFCVVSGSGPIFAQYVFASSSSTTVVVATYNISGANADEPFSIACYQ